MASRRSRSGDLAAGTGDGPRSRRGFVTMTLPLPRYVLAKPLASGATGFYFNIPTRYRSLGCSIRNEPLGTDYSAACGVGGNGGRAGALNALFDEWLRTKSGEPLPGLARYGSVD